MTQTALDMPDGLRPPFYIVFMRYGHEYREEYDELAEALAALRGGEDAGELSTRECGDQDGWLWRRSQLADGSVYEAHPRAPARPSEYFYRDDDE